MRLLTKKAYGLEDVFYMVCVNEDSDFWQVRTKDNHYVVIATSGFQHTLDCVYTLVTKYKTYGKLKESLNGIEYKHTIKDSSRVNRDLRISTAYEDDLEEVISRAMNDINEAYNNSGVSPKKKKPLLKKKSPEPEETTPKKRKRAFVKLPL